MLFGSLTLIIGSAAADYAGKKVSTDACDWHPSNSTLTTYQLVYSMPRSPSPTLTQDAGVASGVLVSYKA